MSEKQKDVSNVDDKVRNDVEKKDDKKEVVLYETHKKLLEQRKADQEKARKVQEELDAFKAEKTRAEEKKLAEEGEFKKLLELERDKNAKLNEKLGSHEKNMTDAHKLNEFKKLLPGELSNPEYFGFVDLEKIVIDPETKTVDATSVKIEVERFVAKHSGLLSKAKKVKLPNEHGKDNDEVEVGYRAELDKCTSQAQFDAVRKKYGKKN